MIDTFICKFKHLSLTKVYLSTGKLGVTVVTFGFFAMIKTSKL